jgi:enamine deaminase RidA (YjgF/YER057c/UK114 family)
MRNLGLALEALGITPAHVVRVHIFTTDMDLFLEEGRPIVYSFFGDTPPASTLVGVSVQDRDSRTSTDSSAASRPAGSGLMTRSRTLCTAA